MIATTRAALFRATITRDDLDDDVETWTQVATPAADADAGRSLADFPASAVERSRREFDEASNMWRTIRYFAGRVPAYVPAAAGDQLRSTSGEIFVVLEVEGMARGLSGRSSVTLTMRRAAP